MKRASDLAHHLVCVENLVHIDLVTESPHVGDDGGADIPLLNLVASLFKSKSRLEVENAA